MKCTIVLLLAACLQVSARSYSQTISVDLNNVSMEKALKEIGRQSGYHVFYKQGQLKHAIVPVSIKVEKKDVRIVLDELFKNQPLQYHITNETIVVSPKEEKKSQGSTIPRINPGDIPPPPTKDISGKVTDAEGNPLAGASIKVRGGTLGTSTNADGVFILKGVDEKATIEISFVGYETVSLAVGSRTSFIVSLKVKEETLQEVVVNKGYYTEKQKFSVGNVAKVTASDIEKQPVANVLLAMQGRVPGMEIIQANGLPGSGVRVRIRGQNSIQNGNDPLYVIDGVPYVSQLLPDIGPILGSSGSSGINGNPLSYINPSDIEAIDILKEADATAIYGSRGANGVVLITTKKGKPGQTKVDINIQSGWGKVNRKLDLLNTRQYLDMRYEALRNDGTVAQPWDFDLTLWDTARHTDWQEELIGGTARYNDFQTSISAGNNLTQYLVGAGFHNESSVFPGSLNNTRGSLHFNINSVSPNQKLRFLLTGNYLLDESRLIGNDLTHLAVTLSPNAPPLYKSDGTLNWAPDISGIGTWENPLAYLNNKFTRRTNNLIANSVISYQLLPHLTLKSSLGYNYIQMDEFNGFPATYFDPAYLPVFGNDIRSARYSNNNVNSWIVEPQIDYTKNFGNRSKLNVLIGTTFNERDSKGEILNAKGFNSDLVLEDIKSATSVTIGSTINSRYNYNAFFGRVNYNWLDKYLINLTARRDGTSRFGPENRFHNFAGIGAGWVFSKENFIQTNLKFISYGKIRGSYGTTGSDQVGDYTFLDLYNPNSVGVPYQGAGGIGITRHYTPDLEWEETKKLEVGLELGLLKDRVTIGANYYKNRSGNQLTTYQLPSITGFTSVNKNLDALVQNSGYEISLSSTNIKSKDFSWTSFINLTSNRNKLVSVAPGMSTFYQKVVGYSLGGGFSFHFLGVDPITGVYQFADSQGNPTANPNSTTDAIVFKDVFTRYFGGFENRIVYKQFELDVLLQFVKQLGPDFKFGDYPGQFYGGGVNQPISVLNRWQKSGDATSVQRFNQDFSFYQQFSNIRLSDAYYTDASFIRLKNVSLSWLMPESWSKKIHFQNCKIYVHAQNLITITNYKGLDPETRSNSSLPPLRMITTGIQLTL